MKQFRFVILLFTLLILPACQAAADVSGSKDIPVVGKQTKLDETIFAANPDPLNVTVVLDPAAGAEALIPVEGGSLSVTGADGTTYTLTIPADALLTETNIRMQPVSSITGMPFGSETHAVQLYPEGLFFNNFVTLTITPTAPIPVDQQITFGYLADGKDVILAPPVMDSSEIKIQLLHFSGYGITKGLLADIEPVRQRIGGDAERRLQSQTAEILGKERQIQLLGGESDVDLAEFFSDIFNQFEEQVIRPRVAAAGESCAAGRLALQTVLGAERQRQLLGMGTDGFMQSYPGLMNTVAGVCLKEEYEMCANDHIIHRMIPVWLGFERQYQLLGVNDTASIAALQQAKDLAVKCLTFELVLESTGNFDDGSGGLMTSIVKAKVPLKFIISELLIRGESALYNESYQYTVPGCSVTPVRGGGTFTANGMAYHVDTSSPTDPIGHVTDISLQYYPGLTTESFTIKCEDSPAYTSPPNGIWTGIYLVLHQDEMDQSAIPDASQRAGMDVSGLMAGGAISPMSFGSAFAGAAFVAKDWEIKGGELFAQKEWIKTDEYGLGLTEAGTFKLYHRPGK